MKHRVQTGRTEPVCDPDPKQRRCGRPRKMRFLVGLSLVVFLAGCESTTETIDLPKPAVGERWLCGNRFDFREPYDPSVILTRETLSDEPFGYGKVVVGGVTYDAFFSIDGADLRWDLSNNHAIFIDPGGDGSYHDFRFSDSDGQPKPRDFLKCVQG